MTLRLIVLLLVIVNAIRPAPVPSRDRQLPCGGSIQPEVLVKLFQSSLYAPLEDYKASLYFEN